MRTNKLFLLKIIVLLFLSGCAAKVGGDPAAATLEYLKALAKQDKTAVMNLSCKDWEEQAAMEVDALLSVGSVLNEASCEQVGEDGDQKLIKCTGLLELTYQDEIRSIDLSRRVYSMLLEDGKWRVCSYR